MAKTKKEFIDFLNQDQDFLWKAVTGTAIVEKWDGGTNHHEDRGETLKEVLSDMRAWTCEQWGALFFRFQSNEGQFLIALLVRVGHKPNLLVWVENSDQATQFGWQAGKVGKAISNYLSDFHGLPLTFGEEVYK
jgi:hypothetical protein